MDSHKLQKIMQTDNAYVFNTYARQKVAFIKGKGAKLQDTKGREYIDFGSGIGVCSLGYGNKALTKALKKSAKTLIHTSNLYHIAPQAKLAKRLVKYYQKDMEKKEPMRVFFANSGAEANECAIKLARKFGEKSAPNGKDRYKIITLDSSFHGRTIASLKATGQDKFHQHFGPYPDGFVRAKNIKDIQNVVDSHTCAVLLELVQGEGGVCAMDKKEVQELERFCKQKNILLMVDEVQSGIYRSGEIFASKLYGISPDVITTAKGLGGGVPIGACMSKKIDVFAPGDHGSTFGGNFLATNAGLKVLKTLESMRKNSELEYIINYFHNRLDSLLAKYPKTFSKKTGLGLMCGLEIRDSQNYAKILESCFKARVLVLKSGKNVLRFLPPLNITKSEVDEGFKRIETALMQLKLK
ncbi:aspartate aminotransferase family protein [Helicobacter himalayensis]|uniref:aspartate aminotransferase family protein n=1 Tax=Helicobacter himalayensis TaxID=1591088 RepID=UPI003D6EF83F